ncbi:MAG: hypothetical protein FJX29_15510 [Alphaproteobacteria bacterium]|nr:hypothetical protein [Alphaproteobacteria bacterium]
MQFRFKNFLAAVVLAPVLAASAALAKDGPAGSEKPSFPEVAGGDIFGFTAPTDTGDPGSHGAGLEIDGAFGKRGGRYNVLTQKWAYERVVAENWSMGFAMFTAFHSLRNVPGMINRSAFAFDGLGFEIGHRLVERSATNPFAFKIAIEPRWGRLDDGGRHANSFGAELKFLTDAVVVPGRLYWAMNVVLASGTGQDPDTRRYAPSSEIKVSNALTMQISPSLLMGVEATYLAAFDGGAFNSHTGHAVFLGPTIFWKVADKVSLNATIAPQIAGRANGAAGLRHDLDNYTRLMTRFKLSVEF